MKREAAKFAAASEMLNTEDIPPLTIIRKISKPDIKTALGLRGGIELAFWLTVAGAVVSLDALVVILWQRHPTVGWLALLSPAAAAGVYVLPDIRRLSNSISGVTLAASIERMKRAAQKVPI